MMILGVGLDLCDATRLRRALARRGFIERVFAPVEIEQCGRRRSSHLHYAARFAAKEAYFKAIGTGWGGGVAWREVAVESDGESPPRLSITGAALRISRSLGVTRAHVTLTHSGDYAAAVVVLEGPGRPSRR